MSSQRQRRVLLIVAVAAVVVSAGGLGASTLIKSPAQVEASTAPPAPNLLTAPVLRQVVANTLVLRGTVGYPQQFSATPASEVTQQSGGSGSGSGAPLVITDILEPTGSTVNQGQVIVEVSGRPLFALAGTVPVYRDLAPGDTGKDIAQLQADLKVLGFPTGSDPTGSFGPGTKTAVSDFYQSIGYSAPMSGSAANVEAAQDTVTQDQAALAALKTQQQASSTPPTSVTTPAGGDIGSNGSSGASAPTTSGASLPEQITAAEQALTAAEQNEQSVAADTGPMIPASEVIFLPSFPAHVSKINGSVGSSVTAPLVTMSVGAPTIEGQLPPSQQPLVRKGMTVNISDSLAGFDGHGLITAIGTTTSDANSDSGDPYLPVTIEPSLELPSDLVGQDLQLTVDAAKSNGAVLAVPEAAIFAGADGRTYVTRLATSGAEIRVPVDTGLSGDGLVTITPTRVGSLRPGEKVVTGLSGTRSSSSSDPSESGTVSGGLG